MAKTSYVEYTPAWFMEYTIQRFITDKCLADTSAVNYSSILKRFLDFCQEATGMGVTSKDAANNLMQQFAVSLCERNKVSYNTFRKYVVRLNTFCKWAYERELVPFIMEVNPKLWMNWHTPEQKKLDSERRRERKNGKALPKDQIAKLMLGLKKMDDTVDIRISPKMLRVAVGFMYNHCIRVSELRGIQWGDFKVKRNAWGQYYALNLNTKTTGSYGQTREIYLCALKQSAPDGRELTPKERMQVDPNYRLLMMLKQYLKSLKGPIDKSFYVFGKPEYDKEGRLVCMRKYQNNSSINKPLRQASGMILGEDKAITTHALHYSRITSLLQDGVPLESAADIAGKSLNVVNSVYKTRQVARGSTPSLYMVK